MAKKDVNKLLNPTILVIIVIFISLFLFKGETFLSSVYDLDDSCTSNEPLKDIDYHNTLRDMAGLSDKYSCPYYKGYEFDALFNQSSTKFCFIDGTDANGMPLPELDPPLMSLIGSFELIENDLIMAYVENISTYESIVLFKLPMGHDIIHFGLDISLPKLTYSKCSEYLVNYLNDYKGNFSSFSRNGRLIYFLIEPYKYLTCNLYDNYLIMSTPKMMDWYFGNYIKCENESVKEPINYSYTINDTYRLVYSGYEYDETEKTCILKTKHSTTNPFKYFTKSECMAAKRADAIGILFWLEKKGISATAFFNIFTLLIIILFVYYFGYEKGPKKGFFKRKKKKRKRK